MKAVAFALRTFGRELRSGEVLVLLAAVGLAVGALTAVGFLTDRIGKAVARQANEVLAADLRLRSQEPVPAAWSELAAGYGLDTAETMSFPSVVFAGDNSALASINAISEGYPLRGTVRVADQLFGEQREVEGIPESGEVWADGTLLARVGADIGDVLSVGELDLRVSAVLTYRPDQSIGFASLAPSLLMNAADISRSGLIGEGSRVSYALLVAGDEGAVTAFNEAIQDKLPESVRIRSQEESSERAYNAADRAQRFLSLTAVMSLLLSAVAVAMSARRFAHRRMDTVALMKSLGATQGFVIAVALIQLMLLGVLGVVVGSIAGFAAEELLSRILVDLIASDLPNPGLRPVVLASGSAMVLLLGFALPALIQLRNTPPLRVLRHDAMPPPPSRLLVSGLSLAAVAALLYGSVGDPRMLVILIGGIMVIAGALYLVGRGLVALIGRFRSGVGVAWRYGLANVARRGRASAVQVVAFGLGLTVLLLLTLVRTDLLEGWRQTLDADAPNHFLINIQPDEVNAVGAFFEKNGVKVPRFTPLVRARMTTINGTSVKDREYPNDDGRWLANREANLSWTAEMSPSNELLQGEWWPADYDGPPLVSIEEESAINAGLKIGDRLKFFVAGQQVEAGIASIRKVNWDSFQPNFFIVLSPGALDGMPTTYISSMKIEDDQQSMLVDLVRSYPSISVIDLGAILEQVRGIIEKASLAVQAVFVFTLAAGVAVLFAAVQSTIDERRFESAMLRALGARRRTVFFGVMAEFAALGVAAGILASAGASILAAVVAVQLFQLPYEFNPLLWVIGLTAGVLLVCISGFFAARGAINAAPADVLRMAT
ncbi:MAG: FtsX-like permease family protein [Gammaproteobacteria bacterium]|nr:FtsX-like permease family protein [Gammaproteobacteria bacterium]MBT8109992.1 FtsX-like permease family protein [Gammaproteobacteria bacterium]NND47329.1 FtsX-like permease family protein [Woeseiaceae bacterium]NNL44694.1 FtsX-like permease family protein [Woeseiaceae bacterium]